MYGSDTKPSAEILARLLIDVFRPHSVVDVGCGQGVLLSALCSAGTAEILGIDGPEVEESFEPGLDNFLVADLIQPLETSRQFDVAVCLEVAEHLPEEAATTLVASLARLSSVVVFSAAIPGQGGHEHINEQWPIYWQHKFHEAGYLCLDLLRNSLASEPKVLDYYRANIFVYADSAAIRKLFENPNKIDLTDPYIRAIRTGIRRDLQRCSWHDLCFALIKKATRRLRGD